MKIIFIFNTLRIFYLHHRLIIYHGFIFFLYRLYFICFPTWRVLRLHNIIIYESYRTKLYITVILQIDDSSSGRYSEREKNNSCKMYGYIFTPLLESIFSNRFRFCYQSTVGVRAQLTFSVPYIYIQLRTY